MKHAETIYVTDSRLKNHHVHVMSDICVMMFCGTLKNMKLLTKYPLCIYMLLNAVDNDLTEGPVCHGWTIVTES